MKKNKFWVLEKILKLEKQGETEPTVEIKKQPTLPPDEEYSIKDWQKPTKVVKDDSLQASIEGNQEDIESSIQDEGQGSEQIEKKVEDGLLDFKLSLRVKKSNPQNEQQIQGELKNAQLSQGQQSQGQQQNEQQTQSQSQNGEPTQGQSQNGQPSQGQAQNGESTQGQAQNGQPSQGQAQNRQSTQGQAQNGQPSQGQSQDGQSTEGQDGEASQEQSENNQSQQKNGEPQNNRAKQLFSSVKRFDEGTDKSWGFALSTEDDGTDIPDSVINMLIEKFLNQRFLPTNTDLNTRQNNMKQEYGDLKWNIPDLIRHKVTKDLNKMLHDKYGYADEDGKGEDIPLSFYFDLSGSMSKYSRLLSLIAIKLMANKVKILFGYNEKIYYQIDKVPKTFTVEDFKSIIEKEMEYSQIKADPRYKGVEIKEVNRDIHEYLREKKAKKLTAFTDFDPKRQIEDLSKDCEIWWFCFEERSSNRKVSMENFKGHFYNTTQLKQFQQHLKNIKSRVYEKRQRQIREGGFEH